MCDLMHYLLCPIQLWSGKELSVPIITGLVSCTTLVSECSLIPIIFIEMKIYYCPHYTVKMEYKVVVSPNFEYLIRDGENMIIYHSITLGIPKSEFFINKFNYI